MLPRPLRRTLRRLRRLLRPPPALVVFDPRYSVPVSGVPMDPERGAQILSFLLDEGLIDEADVERPRPASVRDLRRVHTDRYLASLEEQETLTSIYGTPVPPDVADRLLDAMRWMTGGTILAARLAIRTRRVAVSLGGGQHHAEPDRGMGFCVYNDVAVAIARLRARGWNLPVLVVDLDLHVASPDDLPTSVSYRRTAVADGVLSGLCVYFSAGFDEQRWFTSSPDSTPTHWGSPLLRVESQTVRAGDTIEVALSGPDLAHPGTWQWEVKARPEA